MGGMRMSFTSEVMMAPKAAPSTRATARSTTFPRVRNALTSWIIAASWLAAPWRACRARERFYLGVGAGPADPRLPRLALLLRQHFLRESLALGGQLGHAGRRALQDLEDVVALWALHRRRDVTGRRLERGHLRIAGQPLRGLRAREARGLTRLGAGLLGRRLQVTALALRGHLLGALQA